jgi:prepilin-type N-terminal cleavage/methylation domain-containing protein
MNNKNGFTLTELMIVVSIIAFLGILVTGYLRSQVFKGNDAKRKAEIKRIGIAVEEYEKDNNCYPLSSIVNCTNDDGLQPYLNKIPCDPTTQASYFYEHEDSICPRWYRIYSALENDQDIDYQAGIGPNSAFTYVLESNNAPAMITGGGGSPSNYYGCISGICTSIGWNASRPGPSCDPNFQNLTCYGQCGNPSLECQTWNP